MSDEWKPYVVQQGDHTRKLAYRAGTTADAVWAHPKNAELATRRASRDVLLPGDVIHLPAAPDEGLSLASGAKNRYRAEVPRVHVHLRLADGSDTFANAPFEVLGTDGSDVARGTTGPGGELSFEAAVFAREVSVSLHQGLVIVPLRIGDLDPITESSGTRQRLVSLGYLPEDAEAHAVFEADAVYGLRKAAALPPSDALDDEARDALDQRHRARG